MIAGHFGLAAGVKARERQVPLWALMLATVWLDIVFAPLLAAGVERIENVPGSSGGYVLPLAAGPGRAPRGHADPARQRRRPAPPRVQAVEGASGSILVELALVVAGAWLYWRAAVQTSAADTRRANLLGLLVLAAGLITLAVDALVA